MRWVGGFVFNLVHNSSRRCPLRGGKVVKKANFCPRSYWMTQKKKVHISLRGWVICLHPIQNLHQGCMRSSSLSFRLRNLIFLGGVQKPSFHLYLYIWILNIILVVRKLIRRIRITHSYNSYVHILGIKGEQNQRSFLIPLFFRGCHSAGLSTVKKWRLLELGNLFSSSQDGGWSCLDV